MIPPKCLTLLGAFVLLVAIFLGVYFGAAILGGLICGVSLRFHLSSTAFTCRYLPSILASIVYFALLFSMSVWIKALRSFMTRLYHRTFSGADSEKYISA